MMMRRATPVFLSILLAGCSFFSRTKNTIYSLDRVPPAAPPAAAAVRGLPISIEGIELPPGFDRREIVVRKPDHQLDVRGTQQWSADLQSLVLHTLAFDLAARLPEGMIILPGEVKPAGVTRAIDVAIEDIAAGPDARVVLDAHWVLHESGRPDATRHEQIAVSVASLDSAQIADGLSRALGELADRIAAALR